MKIRYLFSTKSGVENFFIGTKSEWTKGERILASTAKLTIRKSILSYIDIGTNTELEYIGTFIDLNHKSKGPTKIFQILNSKNKIYVKPYPYCCNGFYVGYVLEDNFDKHIKEQEEAGYMFIEDETKFFNEGVV